MEERPDYLTRLTLRALGLTPLAQPRIAPRFAPGRDLKTTEEWDSKALEIPILQARPSRSSTLSQAELLAKADQVMLGMGAALIAAPPKPEERNAPEAMPHESESNDSDSNDSEPPQTPESLQTGLSLDEYLERRRRGFRP